MSGKREDIMRLCKHQFFASHCGFCHSVEHRDEYVGDSYIYQNRVRQATPEPETEVITLSSDDDESGQSSGPKTKRARVESCERLSKPGSVNSSRKPKKYVQRSESDDELEEDSEEVKARLRTLYERTYWVYERARLRNIKQVLLAKIAKQQEINRNMSPLPSDNEEEDESDAEDGEDDDDMILEDYSDQEDIKEITA